MLSEVQRAHALGRGCEDDEGGAPLDGEARSRPASTTQHTGDPARSAEFAVRELNGALAEPASSSRCSRRRTSPSFLAVSAPVKGSSRSETANRCSRFPPRRPSRTPSHRLHVRSTPFSTVRLSLARTASDGHCVRRALRPTGTASISTPELGRAAPHRTPAVGDPTQAGFPFAARVSRRPLRSWTKATHWDRSSKREDCSRCAVSLPARPRARRPNGAPARDS
jgi:hypothetical protein